MASIHGKAPALPRIGINSSALVRQLAALPGVAAADARQSLAEGLSQWLDWRDASALHAALNQPLPAAAGTAPAEAAAAALAQLKQRLAQAIGSDPAFNPPAPPPRRIGLPAAPPMAAEPLEPAELRRRCQAHQRRMDEAVGPLRASVRALLLRSGGMLARLAALDAVLDEALLARERHLLGSVPTLLEQHFNKQHAADAAPGPAARAEQGRLLQRVLLAELDTRTQPIEALIEALRHHAEPAAAAP